ncbi:t-SNARE [Umbelopsis sp. PMI_123]|nr:t-SNARE [Umbelopsis sp. PMI_123]
MSFNDLERGYGPSNSGRGSRARTGPIAIEEHDDLNYKQITQRISQQIFHINGNISSIDRLIDFLGSPRDSAEIRNKLHDVTESTRDLVKDTSEDIKLLSQCPIPDDRTARQRKLEQQKLSKDFQKVISEFQRAQRLSASKQREYVDKAKATTAMLQSQTGQPFELEEHASSDHEPPVIEDPQRRLQLQALDNEIEYNEALITEREGEIQEIEQGITELNEIFRDLGTLVNEQETGIQSIYGNVLNIAQSTRDAASELVTANRHQKNARKNMCCLLLIIVVVACILTLILVVAK